MEAALIRGFEDRRLPRYTSCPTASHFSAGLGDREARAWLEALGPGATLSLYVHVPLPHAVLVLRLPHAGAGNDHTDRPLRLARTRSSRNRFGANGQSEMDAEGLESIACS